MEPQKTWPPGIIANDEYEAALNFIENDDGHLFVTGRAGTGKSTLLRVIRDMSKEDLAVLAPTGIAAVNVGGQTIHSFFGFPPRLIRPDDIKRSRNGRIMRRLKFLIIDEISMVRSDLMWAIDQSLRINRGRPRDAFGGVRLLMFGDLHQLPPVIQEAEVAGHLDSAHGGPFFFTVSSLLEGTGTHVIELTEVYRQDDEDLIRILNHIRDGDIPNDDLEALNGRVHAIKTLADGEPYVILTPTNAAAHRINLAYLNALPTSEHTFQAKITGDFSRSAHPTDTELTLKEGAKVIMLRNDPDGRWVNGSIARISQLNDNQVFITIGEKDYEIEPVAWEARRYAFDQSKDKIVETVAGTFLQYPIRLAWALTIHKSQGLTLDRAYIDLGRGTFAHGQTYVALSRCRSLNSLALARPLRPQDILFDPTILGYRRTFSSAY